MSAENIKKKPSKAHLAMTSSPESVIKGFKKRHVTNDERNRWCLVGGRSWRNVLWCVCMCYCKKYSQCLDSEDYL